MLDEFLKSKGYTVYRAAKESGLPYTTLNELVLGKKSLENCSVKTVAALAGLFKMPIDLFLKEAFAARPAVINPTWERTKDKCYIFPVLEPTDSFDISRVHPLKQREVLDVLKAISGDPRILRITLFGSATGIRCCRVSDIDLCIRLKDSFTDAEAKNEISEKIQEACGYDADILWADKIKEGSTIDVNIKKGVIIFEAD